MNIKLNISPVVLLRIPAFAITDELSEVWEELKESICHSSNDFYDKIKEFKAADLQDLDSKMQFTIWKYFNRSKYRGTPFGSFAGFAVAGLGQGKEGLVLSRAQYLHRFKDWSRYQAPELSEAQLSASDRFYFSNSSHYIAADQIRFISLGGKVFELSEIACSEVILELLSFCAERVAYPQLLEFALEQEIAEEVLLGMLKAMVDSQLLFTDLNANLIGPEYFGRTGQAAAPESGDYLIAERKLISGELSSAGLKHLPACVNTLLSLNQTKVNEGLNSLIKDFNKHYEGQEVPLMTILDPELGIGYGAFVSAAAEAGLAEELSGYSGKKGPALIPWTGLAHELVKAMLKGNGRKTEVLQLKDLMPAKREEEVLKPGNSFSVLARFAGDLVVLDAIGGCTANSLSGRFTLASEPFREHCKTIAAGESAANPDVIFFDMAYMAEGRVDNVNRRAQIYDQELPILNYSCTEQLIGLHDIMVSIKGEEVILSSKKYGKRLVPRLASAYNYNRSDLAVYRFLCDLQHQGIQTQFLFDVQQLLPGLDYYPRIQYENLVLSPAKWRLKGAELKVEDTLALLDKTGLGNYFSVGTGDQTLCFNKASTSDLLFLKQYANQYDDFVLTEVICSDCQEVVDEYKKSYFTQVLLAVSHQEKIYTGYIPGDFPQQLKVDPVIMPGKDWLYYEIYGHPDRSNFLLRERILKFINAHEEAFHTWFFIRYNDPRPHLRLRIQLKDQEAGYFYMTQLMDLLTGDLHSGLIKDVQMKTYYREIARYGALQMELTEQHFSIDSAYALEVLDNDLDDYSIYANCIQLMKAMLPVLQLEKKALPGFIRSVQRAFEEEHHLKTEDFKMVNREWADFKPSLQAMESGVSSVLDNLQASFRATLMATAVEERRALFCSLFHMHLNRLFSDHQRAHELLVYSFLYKQLQMELQRLTVL
ncbi:thiopeptide-type bacteriocin biosynthesis protein [Pedobacter gandavensis]|uniref:lantibiotic dehydratase n=1 Tax=Pedobacter gandavensis TaxID=2679963 RepID=UPI00292D95D6|nr:thiopeptide-type bacteriocin biosynthesis protein [Pedobacter gandavensis]